MTFSINDTQYENTMDCVPLWWVPQFIYRSAECRCTEKLYFTVIDVLVFSVCVFLFILHQQIWSTYNSSKALIKKHFKINSTIFPFQATRGGGVSCSLTFNFFNRFFECKTMYFCKVTFRLGSKPGNFWVFSLILKHFTAESHWLPKFIK